MDLKRHKTGFRSLSFIFIQIHRRHLRAFHLNSLAVSVPVIRHRQLITALGHFEYHVRSDLRIDLRTKTDPATLKQLCICQGDRSMPGCDLYRKDLFLHPLHTEHIVLANLRQGYFLSTGKYPQMLIIPVLCITDHQHVDRRIDRKSRNIFLIPRCLSQLYRREFCLLIQFADRHRTPRCQPCN